MPTTATVPTTITPEAAAWIAKLGLQAEFELMLEHTKQAVPDALAILVEESANAHEPEGAPVIIVATRPEEAGKEYDPSGSEWDSWAIRTFPTDVHRWFIFTTNYGHDNAG